MNNVNIELFTNDLRKSPLSANTVPIVFMRWSTNTTQHQTLLIYTLLLSPRPSNHGYLSHGKVWRSKRQEEMDGKQKENGVVADVALIC